MGSPLKIILIHHMNSMTLPKFVAWLFISSALALSSGCYYEHAGELNPEPETPVAAGCDTTNVSYAGFVQPLLAQHCTGCHAGSLPSGGIALNTHAEVKRWAEAGLLYGAMAHLDGFSAMPKGGGRLPQCDIYQVKAWIDAGSTDN
jgi:cytochrome c5